MTTIFLIWGLSALVAYILFFFVAVFVDGEVKVKDAGVGLVFAAFGPVGVLALIAICGVQFFETHGDRVIYSKKKKQ